MNYSMRDVSRSVAFPRYVLVKSVFHLVRDCCFFLIALGGVPQAFCFLDKEDRQKALKMIVGVLDSTLPSVVLFVSLLAVVQRLFLYDILRGGLGAKLLACMLISMLVSVPLQLGRPTAPLRMGKGCFDQKDGCFRYLHFSFAPAMGFNCVYRWGFVTESWWGSLKERFVEVVRCLSYFPVYAAFLVVAAIDVMSAFLLVASGLVCHVFLKVHLLLCAKSRFYSGCVGGLGSVKSALGSKLGRFEPAWSIGFERTEAASESLSAKRYIFEALFFLSLMVGFPGVLKRVLSCIDIRADKENDLVSTLYEHRASSEVPTQKQPSAPRPHKDGDGPNGADLATGVTTSAGNPTSPTKDSSPPKEEETGPPLEAVEGTGLALDLRGGRTCF